MKDAVAIAPLTKISLEISKYDEEGNPPIPDSQIDFDFVFGIATEGFTAFEKTLFNKAPGDRIRIRIEPSQMELFFDYLSGPLRTALGADPPYELEVRVSAVKAVSDRELVHALARKAETSGFGCGGGCGCGC